MARQTSLHSLHASLGATFREENGWELPERFSSPEEEHSSVRERVGLADLSFRGKFRVTGTDRVRFLNGMVTGDVAHITEGGGVAAAQLTPQGKVLAVLRILAASEAFWVDTDAVCREKVLDTLNKYIIADDVTIEDVGDEWALLHLAGPGARSLLQDLLGHAPALHKEGEHVEETLGRHQVRIIRWDWTGEEGFDLWVRSEAAPDLWTLLLEKGRPAGIAPVGMAAWEILRIEAGLPRYGVDVDERYLFMEIGREDWVSFTKGCYIGQEYVIRIAHRGHVNKKLSGLTLSGTTVPRTGDPIRTGEKEIGTVTSATFSPSLQAPVALGFLHRDFLEPGTAVTITRDGTPLPATVTALPFYHRTAR